MHDQKVPAHSVAIDVQSLSKHFGDVHAVEQLNFTIPKGVIAGFVGPNGAGKTTTIRMLLGLVSPTGGSGTVLGHSIRDPKTYLHDVGAMIEGPAFYPSMSGAANLLTCARAGGYAKTRVPELLDLVGLKDRAKDKVGSYSMGMKQRLGIAVALLADPKLLILDEPLNGLDPPGILQMRAFLKEKREQGTTILISSHLLGEVEQVADWLVIVQKGTAKYVGRPSSLPGRSRSYLQLVPERAEDVDQVATIAKALQYETSTTDGKVVVVAPSAAAGEINRRCAQAGITLVEITPQRASLETSFFEIIGSDAVHKSDGKEGSS